ncbi:unnamed protein product [Prunus armeniaca]|uniref:Phosphatidylinositol N-acetylglucosaminyltransferase n=1 Tax=Prunus armeniaca TaxID=36596 RepID=A0A6J5Y7N2_PRUAR|nr:unnamed protein product [Prunus armeniaca]
MDTFLNDILSPTRPRWRKVAYGGMQPGFDDNHTDDSFLEDMVMNANVVKRDILKVMLDSVSISQYLCIVALVGLVWTYTLRSILNENSLLLLDVTLLGLGFLVLLLTKEMLSFNLFFRYLLNISFFISGLYVLAPIYQTLTTSISSNSIWAVTVSLLVLHLFLHDYYGSTVRAPGALHNPTLTSCISLNASVVASVFIASCLRSRLLVFAIMLFSLQVFLFAPLVTYCIKKYSFRLHLWWDMLGCCYLGNSSHYPHVIIISTPCLLLAAWDNRGGYSTLSTSSGGTLQWRESSNARCYSHLCERLKVDNLGGVAEEDFDNYSRVEVELLWDRVRF